MKNLIFFAFLLFTMSIKAQIVFEHAYDSSSTIQGNANPKLSQLMIIKFEISGERYVRINALGKNICIYNMNHSLLKRIDCSGLPVDLNFSQSFMDILYLSEQLFDTDAKMEFMYVTKINTNGWDSWYTGIYNEDGTLIFSDTAAPIIKNNVPLQQYPIYNTTLETKMILSYTTGGTKVFSLPGTLTTAISEANNNLLNASNLSVSNPYPNPANSSTTIDYILPEGINKGEIVFYDLQGNEIKRFKVDRTFNTLLISTADIAAGTYYYQLQTSAQNSGGKKMVVIK